MRSYDTTIPVGLCQCGCGGTTGISPRTDTARGRVKGQPDRFIRSHGGRRSGPDYEVLDMGYVTPCWKWLGTIDKLGYGHTGRGRRLSVVTAHVWMYEDRYGPGSAKPELDHLCRNRSCVNPDHLEPVTHTENQRRRPDIKLSMEAAREIRRLRGIVPTAELASRFNVVLSVILGVQAGRTWREDS